jgi:hypothetical protein
MTKSKPQPPEDRSYTTTEFSLAERISKGKLYEFWRMGIVPRYYMNGKRRIIRHAARLEWQQQMLAESETA